MNKEKGYLYQIRYYIAWGCYKKQSLLDETSIRMVTQYLKDSCKAKEVVIADCEITENYVYLILECKPKHVIPILLKGLKGGSAKYLIKHDERIAKSGTESVWDGLNMISTEPNVLSEIQKYIEE